MFTPFCKTLRGDRVAKDRFHKGNRCIPVVKKNCHWLMKLIYNLNLDWLGCFDQCHLYCYCLFRVFCNLTVLFGMSFKQTQLRSLYHMRWHLTTFPSWLFLLIKPYHFVLSSIIICNKIVQSYFEHTGTQYLIRNFI